MAVPTRPYFIILNGKEHMVEAAQPAAAIQHLIGGQVSELRPARASEVLAWNRAGKDVQVAGTKPARATANAIESTPGIVVEPSDRDLLPSCDLSSEEIAIAERGPDPQAVINSTVKFDGGDALRWLEHFKGFNNKSVRSTWDSIVASGRMTLEQFDAMREAVGGFTSALAFDRTKPEAPIGVGGLRSRLEEEPMPIEAIIERIGEAVARERGNEVMSAA